MNPKRFLKCQAAAILVLLTCTTVPLAAQVPELMWYQLDEGGGTVAMNAAPIATAVGNMASPVIGHELTPGVGCGGSGALRGFMGTVNYVDTGWLPAIPAGAPWSIGFFIDWSNISVPTSTPSYLVFATGGDQGSSTFITCTMAYNQSQNLYTGFTLERHDGTCFATTGSIVPVGRHLIVFTYDPSTTVIGVWVDAVLITSNWTLSSSLPGLSVGGAQTLRIGGRHENGGFGLPYDVILDDFRLFSHKLTPAEIASWYSSCPSWTAFTPGPPPPNDSCSSPTPVVVGMNGPFTTKYATPTSNTVGWVGICGIAPTNDVWFSFTPPLTGDYAISTCALSTPLVAADHHWPLVGIHLPPCAPVVTDLGICSVECGLGSLELGTHLGKIPHAQLSAGTQYFVRVMDRQNYYRGNFNIVISPPPPVPANDTCATAIPLPFAGGSVSGDNSGATTTPLLPPSCSSMSRDVWYSYTGGATPRLVTLSTCTGTTPGFDTVVTVYSGTCGNLVPVACNDDGCGGGQTGNYGSKLTFTVAAAVTYFIAVSSYANDYGAPFTLTVVPPPPNDDCSAAIPLPQSGSIWLDTVSASTTPGLPLQSCAASFSRDVWFSYTSPNCFKAVTVSTCVGTAAGLDTVLTAYTGTCGNLVPLACNDDGCGPGADTSSLTFVAAPGTTYLIALHSFSNLPGGPITVTTSGSGGLLSVAGGCGAFPSPAITATTPHVGSTFTVTVSNGGANSWGTLVVAPGLGTITTPLPGGCSVLLDLTSVALFPFTTSANGTWTVSALLGPQFSCVTGKMQAVLLPPGSSGYLTTQVMAFAVGP